MTNNVLRWHGRLLSGTTILATISILGAGCSSDFSRLTDPFSTASLPTGNQRSIISKQAPRPQTYPGDIDAITTASTNSNSSRIDGVRRMSRATQPYPGEKITNRPMPAYRSTPSPLENRSDPVSLLPEGPNETVIRKTASVRKYGDRVSNQSTIVKRAEHTTAATSKPVGEQKGGWTAAGGTRVTIRKGETLHNLSRRYGVPAREIMRVNGIASADRVTAGQTVLIPTYTFSRRAAISAPDNNPDTTASRSSFGYNGQIMSHSVPIPTPRAKNTVKKAAVNKPVKTRRVKAMKAGYHMVVSGDTLGGIAQRYGVSSSSIRQENEMDTDVVRLGTKLRIPASGSGNSVRIARNNSKYDQEVDPIVTGGPAPSARGSSKSVSRRITKGRPKPLAYTSPQKSAAMARRASVNANTPAQTGVSNFRWPASGRVVSKFGSKVNGAANDGIDISVPVGTPVKAAENGTVIYAGSELEEFGKLILVRHSGGWVSAYAYSSRNLVSRGDTVRRGQTIAKSGRSGSASTPRIHFELRHNSSPVNPLKHLKRT